MKKTKTPNNNSFSIFMEHLYALNNSKFFAGIVMLIMNIGSKYITLELSKSQEDYVKYTLGRQILVFAILWMGTRDIVVALILTCVFIIFADYLLNDTSKYCIIPEKYKDVIHNLDSDGDGKISQKEINDAIHILKKAHKNKILKNKSKPDDAIISKGLYKENFI
tara:strand:- start:2123 stop:2617 length:495 start_codon:yes stop_codon:yes gene_type:complete